MVAAIALAVVLFVAVALVFSVRGGPRGEVHDYVAEFERMSAEAREPCGRRGAAARAEAVQAAEPADADPLDGEMLLDDEMLLVADGLLVFEADRLCQSLAENGIRFCVRQASIDGSYHSYGNYGLGTRMRVFVHQDDFAAAAPILQSVLKIMV